MITPSDGVKRKTRGDLAQPDGRTGRRREAARGAEGSFSSLLRRRAPQIANEPSDGLAIEEELAIEWDPETPVMGRTAIKDRGEYLPVTKTYDELPRFEMPDEEALAAYEPVTTEYRGPVQLKTTRSTGVAGRTLTKAFGTGAAVDEAGSEYEARTTEFRCAPEPTKFLGSGAFWSALKAESPRTQAIGAAFRESPIGKLPICSSPEPFGAGNAGGSFGEMAAELLQRQAMGREKASAAARSRKGRLATSFQRLANHRGKIDSRIWAVGLALTLVFLSWMILLAR